MWKVFCDICGHEVVNLDDIRHINITKQEEKDGHKKDKPCMVERECCVACSEEVRNYIGNMYK